jgi:hypothetical protein
MSLDEMLAREAIRCTIALYIRNADTADYDRHVEVFHPEAKMIIHGGPTLEGRAPIIDALKQGAVKRRAFDAGNFQRHNITTCMIEITGAATATATTYIMVVTELGFDHAGIYVDEFVKEGDRWLIKARRATMEWGRPDSRFVSWMGRPAPVSIKS